MPCAVLAHWFIGDFPEPMLPLEPMIYSSFPQVLQKVIVFLHTLATVFLPAGKEGFSVRPSLVQTRCNDPLLRWSFQNPSAHTQAPYPSHYNHFYISEIDKYRNHGGGCKR